LLGIDSNFTFVKNDINKDVLTELGKTAKSTDIDLIRKDMDSKIDLINSKIDAQFWKNSCVTVACLLTCVVTIKNN